MSNYYNEYRHGEGKVRSRSLVGLVVNGLMMLLTTVAGIALTLTLVAPYIHPGENWIFPVLGLIAPAVYVATLLLTLYWIVRWRWGVAIPLLVLLVVGLFKVPLFFKPELHRIYDKEESYGRGVTTLMTYNVRSFYSDPGQWSFDSVASVIRGVNPDIVCLQEFNRPLSDAGVLDRLLPGYTKVFVAVEGPKSTTPIVPVMIYTKYPTLGSPHSILGDKLQDGQSIWVDLRVGDDTLRIINNHLHSTAITTHDDEFISQHQFLSDTAGGTKIKGILRRFRNNSVLRAEQVDTIAGRVASMPGRKIVCGDFNDTPMSYAYRTMAKGLDDAFSSCGGGYSHTFRGFMNVLRIDYVLYSESIECLSYEVLYDVKLSDHHPVVVRLKPHTY